MREGSFDYNAPIEPEHRYKIKAAWTSYVFIQAIWMLCVLLTPVGIHFHPTKLWAVPFCLVTVANGLHMIYFRFEYNAVVRRAAGLIPYTRFISPSQYDPRYFVPFGIAYALFGVVSVALVLTA